MNEVEESSIGIKKINDFNVRREPKFVYNIGLEIVLSTLATSMNGRLSYAISDKPSFFANTRVFLVFIGFLYIVMVECRSLLSSWNKPGKRRFLTIDNIIGLGFMIITAACGIYATFIVFETRNFLTPNFFGIFGIIWILKWIQTIRSFSSTRDNIHKLIGPFIAIVILISGYTMDSKNADFKPFCCFLAPTMMWFCSIIFGDIEGRANDQDDEVSIFATIISMILFGLVIYAIYNPWVCGIEVMDAVDGKFVKDLYEVGDLQSIIERSTKKVQYIEGELDDIETKLDDMGDISEDFNNETFKALCERSLELSKDIRSKSDTLQENRIRLQSLQHKVNLSQKLIENPDLIKDMVADLRKLRDTYAKPKPGTGGENIIISWFRRMIFRTNEETA